MKTKILLILLLVVQFGFGQQHFGPQRTCAVEETMQKLMADPVARAQYEELQAKFEIELQKLNDKQLLGMRDANVTNATIRIPVAVHFPSAGSASEAQKTCLRRLAQNQVNILNADYNATNADISNWYDNASSFYPGVNVGNMDVQFILATLNHPAGTGLSDGDLAVTFGSDYLGGNESDATWNGYMNLIVKNISALGYSLLGGSPNNTSMNGVVIDNNAFGSVMSTSPTTCTGPSPGYAPGAPYNKGRTLTHELGHYFNLNHTFVGCTNTSCTTQGDRVCDTPPSNQEVYGCPSPGSTVKCSTNTLTMNYMDYTDDACMYMFTAGQATRMLAWYNTISSQFLTNVLLSDNDNVLSNFVIYPNPNKGNFNIQFAEIIDEYSVQVIDQSGRVVFDGDFSTQSNTQAINLNIAARGVYFVTVKTNSAVATKKIIID